jgi:hypothetical protein
MLNEQLNGQEAHLGLHVRDEDGEPLFSVEASLTISSPNPH